MLRDARATDDPEVLDVIARRADDIFVESIEASKRPDFDSSQFATLMLALDRLNGSIADRRRAIALIYDYDEEDEEEVPAPAAVTVSRG